MKAKSKAKAKPTIPARTPRELRQAIKEKRLMLGLIPDPPPEWGSYRRSRMQVAIDCAVLFCRGYKYDTVAKKKGLTGISKQRLNQYLTKGCEFLMSRGVFITLKGDA